MSLRSRFPKVMLDLMDRDDGIVILLGDIGVFSFREVFSKHPSRIYNCGVCEQGMVGLAAGLAMSGLYPVVSSIDSFVVRRSYEFIALDFGLQKLAGAFVTVGGSNDYSKLGATHQCPEGPTLMAQIPGMHIRMPVTEATVDLAITNAVTKRQLSYIRLEESLAVTEPVVEPRPKLHLKLGATNGHAVDPGPQR